MKSRNEPALKQEAGIFNVAMRDSSINTVEKTGQLYAKNQTGIPSHIVYKNKGIKNLNVRLKTIEILEENVGSTLFGISLCTIFGCLLTKKEAKQK